MNRRENRRDNRGKGERSLGVGVGVSLAAARGKHWRQMDARWGKTPPEAAGPGPARPCVARRAQPSPWQHWGPNVHLQRLLHTRFQFVVHSFLHRQRGRAQRG